MSSQSKYWGTCPPCPIWIDPPPAGCTRLSPFLNNAPWEFKVKIILANFSLCALHLWKIIASTIELMRLWFVGDIVTLNVCVLITWSTDCCGGWPDLDKRQNTKVLCVVVQITQHFLVTDERRQIIAKWKVRKRHYLIHVTQFKCCLLLTLFSTAVKLSTKSLCIRGVDPDKKVGGGQQNDVLYINVYAVHEYQTSKTGVIISNRIEFLGTTMLFSFPLFFLIPFFLSHLL